MIFKTFFKKVKYKANVLPPFPPVSTGDNVNKLTHFESGLTLLSQYWKPLPPLRKPKKGPSLRLKAKLNGLGLPLLKIPGFTPAFNRNINNPYPELSFLSSLNTLDI
jgi:hypothetical protein